ncbi:TadG family pilus assembly protein [Rhizobium sp. SL86]|uniref:TadG family pilus assembly protein n=1 Tax=Rhizobium sp. SL86 TaxID=2995148 RepID=UPI0022733E67|nr:TadG family pilus assembly protein [Rhizobium sp. SL86]MCY1667598.1 TadG family pilus assembly protein [Rhizobium sp. SL86]
MPLCDEKSSIDLIGGYVDHALKDSAGPRYELFRKRSGLNCIDLNRQIGDEEDHGFQQSRLPKHEDHHGDAKRAGLTAHMSHIVLTFLGDRSGNIAIMSAAVLVLMAGMAGLVVDVGMARLETNLLQTAAESSAIAAAHLAADAKWSEAREAAKLYAAKNRPGVANLVTDTEVEFGKWESAVFKAGPDINAVRVTASRTIAKSNAVNTIFAHMFGTEHWDLQASAIAILGRTPVCILVLNPTRSDAFDVDPDAKIDAPECGVQVNSAARGALELGSRSIVNVKSIKVVGGVDKSPSAMVSPTPIVGASPMADPYLALTPPANNNCGGVKTITNSTVTITATKAFCSGLTISNATVTFSPGVYVIKGKFVLGTNAHIKGDGVLIYLEGQGSDIFFYSGSSFNLKAPTAGLYAGMVLWSDRKNTADHDIYSKFGASAEGTIYAPSSQVEFENNVVWEAPCIRIVVDRLELDNASIYRSSDPQTECTNNITDSVRLVR